VQALGIGLIFPEDVTEKIDGLRKRFGTERVRAVPPHITLKQPFSSKAETGVIVEILQSVAATTRPFTVVLKDFDYFEGEQNMAFVAVQNPEKVRELHTKIVQVLYGLGEGGEEHQLDRFVPHITITDLMLREQFSSLKSDLAACGFHMEAALDSFVLFANDGTGWKHVHTFWLEGM